MTRTSLAATLVKSLVFLIVTSLATTALALGIADTGLGESEKYKAWFTDATGLIEGDSVRIGGVEVGEVTSIDVVQRRYAQVEFSVEKGRGLPESTTAAVKYLNMVGQRYVDLERGTGAPGRTLDPGSVIPLKRTSPALDLTQLFNGFQPLFQGLSPEDTNKLAGNIVQVLQGEGATVESLVRTVGSLTSTLAGKDRVIGQVITNLNTVLDTINTRERKFNRLVGTVERVVSGFSRDRNPIGEAVQGISELTVTTAGLLQDGRKPLREDIGELGRVSKTLADNAPLVEDFLRKTPRKMRALTRTASYGSWLNLYLCEARVDGVTTSDGSPPPTGLALKDARCKP